MENTAQWKVARIPVPGTDSAESVTMASGSADVTTAGMARIATCSSSRTVATGETMTKVQSMSPKKERTVS